MYKKKTTTNKSEAPGKPPHYAPGHSSPVQTAEELV